MIFFTYSIFRNNYELKKYLTAKENPTHDILCSIFYHFIDIKKLCKPEQFTSYQELSHELTTIFNFKKHQKTRFWHNK